MVGTGFDLVQRAVMRVLPSADEFNLHPSNAEVILHFQKILYITFLFFSPIVVDKIGFSL